MNEADIELNAVTTVEYSLEKLQHWLQYGKHSWSLGAGMIYLPFGLISKALKLIAIVFTPYMLWHLFKAKWYKSVIVLLTIVVLPFIVFQFISVENDVLNFLLMFLPILTFYLYTYIISYMIGEELTKIKTIKRWEKQSRTRK